MLACLPFICWHGRAAYFGSKTSLNLTERLADEGCRLRSRVGARDAVAAAGGEFGASVGTLLRTLPGGSFFDADATLDGAHVLRQARWTPQQVAARQQQPAATTQLQNSPALTAAPAAAAKVGALAPDVGGKGACLVSKWGAVWVVHTDGKTRSHVAMPTAECDLHASIIEDMDKYTKSHGGAGAYSLDERQSKEACMLAGCARHTHNLFNGRRAHMLRALRRPWKRACVSAWQRARRR